MIFKKPHLYKVELIPNSLLLFVNDCRNDLCFKESIDSAKNGTNDIFVVAKNDINIFKSFATCLSMI